MFLNSAIKTILYIIGAIIIGRVKETLFALVIWCIIRKQSGGRHAKKDFVCFVISGSAIFFPVMVSSALKLTLKMIVISVIVINLIYMLYAPYDEYFYAEERKNEKKIAKYKSIVCSNFALIIGYLFETKYLNIAIIILLEQGGLIIHREKGDRNE